MTLNKAKRSVVAIFDSHPVGQAALMALHEAGLDMRQVSVVAKDSIPRSKRSGVSHHETAANLWEARIR